MKRLQDKLTGRWEVTCASFKCRNKPYSNALFAGTVLCRKCFNRELIKDYGSVENGLRYVTR